MAKRKTPLELGRRERQIVETVTRLGEASVADVRGNLADPPSYSAVRSMLGLLVNKSWLKYRCQGRKYLYRPAVSRRKNQQTAITKMLHTFFAGSATDAVAALLDTSAKDLSDEKLNQIKEMIEQAIEDKK